MHYYNQPRRLLSEPMSSFGFCCVVIARWEKGRGRGKAEGRTEDLEGKEDCSEGIGEQGDKSGQWEGTEERKGEGKFEESWKEGKIVIWMRDEVE